MKWIFFAIFCLFAAPVSAQNDAKKTVALMNECLSLFSAAEEGQLILFELTGTLDFKQKSTSTRSSLAEIKLINVEKSAIGYHVNYTCLEGNNCINFIKSDMSTSPLNAGIFFLSDLKAANTLASGLFELCKKYQGAASFCSLQLGKDANGQEPVMKMNQDAPTQPVVATKPVPSNPGSAKKTEKKLNQDEDDMEDVAAKPADEKKPAPKPKSRSAKKEEETDDEAEEEKSPKPKKTNSRKQNREDEGEKEAPEPPTERPEGTNADSRKTGTDACNRWMMVAESGKQKDFKDIEGKEVNANTKINESKLKIKGARKNYISNYKETRAFIAEIKTHADFGLLSEEFDQLQSELDECLGPQWDTHDRSADEEYSDYKGEIRDVEYRHESDSSLPGIRLIILEDGEKYTFFIRICKR
jgi:outer membrane biosynthesis protein TonB